MSTGDDRQPPRTRDMLQSLGRQSSAVDRVLQEKVRTDARRAALQEKANEELLAEISRAAEERETAAQERADDRARATERQRVEDATATRRFWWQMGAVLAGVLIGGASLTVAIIALNRSEPDPRPAVERSVEPQQSPLPPAPSVPAPSTPAPPVEPLPAPPR